MATTLPTEKRKPITDLSQAIILAYGIPKIGKSTFFSHFPNALFISTEEGLNYLQVYESPVKKWMDFINIIRELEENPTKFQTVVIDTLDNLYLYCRQYIYEINSTDAKEIRHESDGAYGRLWDEVDGEFRRNITRLSHIKTIGLAMISHSEEKEVKRPGHKDTETVITHTLPNRARRIIMPLVDIILYMAIENDQRKIFTQPTSRYEAGDKSGKLPAVLPLDYETFIKAYYGGEENSEEARNLLIVQIQKGLVYLAENKIDGFDVETRVENSIKDNLGSADFNDEKITLGALQAYLQKLRAKSRTNKGE